MKLPFTIEQFLEVFKNYNTAVFPIQFIFYLLALIAIYLSVRKITLSDKIISAILSFFWLWMGIAYHFVFFTTINKGAYIFGVLFILQGVLFMWKGVFQNQLTFQFLNNKKGVTGAVLLIFALLTYPLIGYFLGRVYPASPTFGLPCPTTIFSFGILLLIKGRCPVIILVIPFLWSIIGFTAAITLGITEDSGLLISAIITGVFIFERNKLIH
jgi:hypothetical protein